jgi:galactonate dehydratase
MLRAASWMCSSEVCDTHKVGIVPHFTGPVATAAHMHTMMAFPGQVLMRYNLRDRPGLGVSVDEKQLTFVEAMTEGAPAPTHRRPDGSLTHW